MATVRHVRLSLNFHASAYYYDRYVRFMVHVWGSVCMEMCVGVCERERDQKRYVCVLKPCQI